MHISSHGKRFGKKPLSRKPGYGVKFILNICTFYLFISPIIIQLTLSSLQVKLTLQLLIKYKKRQAVQMKYVFFKQFLLLEGNWGKVLKAFYSPGLKLCWCNLPQVVFMHWTITNRNYRNDMQQRSITCLYFKSSEQTVASGAVTN